jgi:hypothetical protein
MLNTFEAILAPVVPKILISLTATDMQAKSTALETKGTRLTNTT